MIYFLDINPEKCAEYHCDYHVISQIPELILMMSNCHLNFGSFDEEKMPMSAPLTEYRWIRQSLSNYRYIAKLTTALCNEFYKRYKTYHYLSNSAMEFLINEPKMEDKGIQISTNREEYVEKKSSIAKWLYTNKPEWYPESALEECITQEDKGIQKYAYERVKHLL